MILCKCHYRNDIKMKVTWRGVSMQAGAHGNVEMCALLNNKILDIGPIFAKDKP